MWLRWFPWRQLTRSLARAHGFTDPTGVLARLHRFAQPAEVAAPIELLRAGAAFHARGLMNTRAIQHNLDWIWPYWVERQFDPRDPSFVPRSFSITHVNLTHRNWTAVGIPGCNALPLVDPRGLVTPFFEGWSLDGWVLSDDGERLHPSKCKNAEQTLLAEKERFAVRTRSANGALSLISEVEVAPDAEGMPWCIVQYTATAPAGGWLIVGVRPCNPEGVSFVHHLELQDGGKVWHINGVPCVYAEEAFVRHAVSTYREGDVHSRCPPSETTTTVEDDVGMATAAGAVPIAAGETRRFAMRVRLAGDKESRPVVSGTSGCETWSDALKQAARLQIPDERMQALYDQHVRCLVLHSSGTEVFAGPLTYKRFWFRDATFILHALLCTGLANRAERILDTFPARQTRLGFFRSQEGEWDANGQALWIMHRFAQLTQSPPKPAWRTAVRKGADWIAKKRTKTKNDPIHDGLLPAGFSAEHLGMNDFYYWDDFWGIAGLEAAACMAAAWGDRTRSTQYAAEAADFREAVLRSLERATENAPTKGMPAAPSRRMDAGAIGSVVAGYPLQLFEATDPHLIDTAEVLLNNCFCGGGFFQDMIHSGINIYLTLHIAQVLLRAGDTRFADLAEDVARLASPTGQWPEAIHPQTGVGCMGDGQHMWAAAEWLMLVRTMFVREEEDELVLLSGILPRWLEPGAALSFGPAPTPWGRIRVKATVREHTVTAEWTLDGTESPKRISVRPPGHAAAAVDGRPSGTLEASRQTG